MIHKHILTTNRTQQRKIKRRLNKMTKNCCRKRNKAKKRRKIACHIKRAINICANVFRTRLGIFIHQFLGVAHYLSSAKVAARHIQLTSNTTYSAIWYFLFLPAHFFFCYSFHHHTTNSANIENLILIFISHLLRIISQKKIRNEKKRHEKTIDNIIKQNNKFK